MRIIHVHNDIKIIRLQDRWIIINKGCVVAVAFFATVAKEMFNDIINAEFNLKINDWLNKNNQEETCTG